MRFLTAVSQPSRGLREPPWPVAVAVAGWRVYTRQAQPRPQHLGTFVNGMIIDLLGELFDLKRPSVRC
jgi:hypothetical protein